MANKTTKLFAFLALFGIIISVVWTWLLIFFWDSNPVQEEVYTPTNTKTITQEDINKIIEKNNAEITSTWVTN